MTGQPIPGRCSRSISHTWDVRGRLGEEENSKQAAEAPIGTTQPKNGPRAPILTLTFMGCSSRNRGIYTDALVGRFRPTRSVQEGRGRGGHQAGSVLSVLTAQETPPLTPFCQYVRAAADAEGKALRPSR